MGLKRGKEESKEGRKVNRKSWVSIIGENGILILGNYDRGQYQLWRIVAGAADWGRQEGGRGDVDGGMGGGGQKVAVKKVEAVEEVELVMV